MGYSHYNKLRPDADGDEYVDGDSKSDADKHGNHNGNQHSDAGKHRDKYADQYADGKPDVHKRSLRPDEQSERERNELAGFRDCQ